MPASPLYAQIHARLQAQLGQSLSEISLERLCLLVSGIIRAGSASPARIARALASLGLGEAKAESIERRIRRIENDPSIEAVLCLHPLARERLRMGRPKELLLILDPTTQEDRVVMVSVAVWYRGRALPLAWAIWPANTHLEQEGFWQRIEALLDEVAAIIPEGVSVTCLADSAFGTPAFTDIVVARGWHYVVRVQDQTRCRDTRGNECPVRELVRYRGQKKKLFGWAFKGRNWRRGSVLVYWGRRHRRPLCLVSDLPPAWRLVAVYRRRYGIEATFRDDKSYGWRWEQGQVSLLEHQERLMVGMAIATWVTLAAGSQVASEIIAKAPTGKRRTRPPEGKQSLFSLGLTRLGEMFQGSCQVELTWDYAFGEQRNWSQEVYEHHANAYVLA